MNESLRLKEQDLKLQNSKTMNISELLNSGSKALKLNKIKTHQLDSELVLSNLLKKQRENLLINLNQKFQKYID